MRGGIIVFAQQVLRHTAAPCRYLLLIGAFYSPRVHASRLIDAMSVVDDADIYFARCRRCACCARL